MSKVNHELENMIYNLEQRKDLAKVDFTQKAVVEVLGYLKELEQKNQRIAELEEKYKEHRKFIKFINEKSLSLEIKLGCIRHDLDLEVEAKQNLLQIKEDLEKELAELKANVILPKFKIGDEIWAVVSYITESEDDIYNNVIETGIVQKIEIDKRELKYWCDNGRIYWEKEFVKLFATKKEAQQKLKELEGK